MANENLRFFSQVLWTDETTFTTYDRVNLNNMRYWSQTNPHWIRDVDRQNRWTVNLWNGVLRDGIIGLFIFDGHLNGESYVRFLENNLPNLLEAILLDVRASM